MMNMRSQTMGLNQHFALSLIVIFSAGCAGFFSLQYSPLFTLAATVAFTASAIWLYISSTSTNRIPYQGQEQALVETSSSNRMLLFMWSVAFFLSITIPKAGKTVSNIPITVANFCILLVFIFWGLTLLFSKREWFRIPLAAPLLVFIAYGIGASCIGYLHGNPYKMILIDLIAFIGFIPGYFLVCSILKTHRSIRYIQWLLLISLMIVCAYGVLQPLLGFERIAVPGVTQQINMATYQGVQKWNIIEGDRQKVYSTFQNGNIFGHHLVMFIPCVAGMLMGMPSMKKKGVVFVVFILACYALILTYSRGALLGAFSGIFCLMIIAKKIRLKALMILLLGVSVFAVFLHYYADRPELRRYDLRKASADPDSFSAGRIYRVHYVMEEFNKLPFLQKITGMGFGAPLMLDNLYIYLLVRFGVLGMIFLVWLFGRFFLSLLAWRANIADEELRGMMNGGIAGLAGSFVHNIVDVLWLFPPLSANFWFLAGITMSIGMIGSQNNNTRNNSQNNSKPARIRSAR